MYKTKEFMHELRLDIIQQFYTSHTKKGLLAVDFKGNERFSLFLLFLRILKNSLINDM